MGGKHPANPFKPAVKHVQACLSARKHVESSFHQSGSRVMLVQACLYAIYTAEVVL